MPHGVYKDYSTVGVSKGPCIIWDNIRKLGYKARSKCGFVLNKCHGVGGTTHSLIILGEGFKTLTPTIATDLIKESAGFPLSFQSTSTRQQGGCNYNPLESSTWPQQWIYNPSFTTVSLAGWGRCDSCGGFGLEVFNYNTVTGEYDPGISIAEFSACAGGCGYGSPSGSGSKDISSYLKNTTSNPSNKNIIVATIDSRNDQGNGCGCDGSGCNSFNVQMTYGGVSKTFSIDATGCTCKGSEDGCKWWKKTPNTKGGTASGMGELNPFPCLECRDALERIGSQGDESQYVGSYTECLSALGSVCSAECCNFFFPCSDNVLFDDPGRPDNTCRRLPREGQIIGDPCMNSSIVNFSSRLNDCRNYFVWTGNYNPDGSRIYSFPCRDSGCCIDPCAEVYNIETDPITGLPNIGDIISWDLCPGNYIGAGVANQNYSSVRTTRPTDFVEAGCSCGKMNPTVSTLCATNPKTGEVYNTSNGSACSLNTLTYEQLYNGQECDPRNVKIEQVDADTFIVVPDSVPCPLLTCEQIRSLGTICIPPVNPGQRCPEEDGLHVLTNFSNYECTYTIERFKELFGESFDKTKKVFQTCIDKQGPYPCKYWECKPMSPTSCGSVPNCKCCDCSVTTTKPTNAYNSYSDCTAACPAQRPGGCITCP